MKILLPTDFSKLSKVAIHYAAEIAKKLNAELVLLHVVFIDAPPRAQAALKTRQILDAMVDNSMQDFIHLTNEIKQDYGEKINISYKIIKSYPVEEVIETFAQHNDIDLIIMGTKGASGLKRVLMGSNAAAVIGNSNIPVIAVPEHARFKHVKHIVYASDLLALNKEMETLIQFARLFDSFIHILNIVSPNSKKKIERIKIKNELINKYNYPKISIHISINDDVEEAIDEYIAEVKADMLAMFNHKPTFFERLFGKSVTREMAFHSWIPLLAIKKNKNIK
ncbi:MAG: universal stress protein [Bacteroidetes bacterium]|nr:universal stress protein [Bacteroidota bacterium]